MTSSDRSLAHRALNVVLQHCMIPDLGWYMTIYESSLPHIRENLIDHKWKIKKFSSSITGRNLLSSQGEEKSFKENLESRLENEYGYFDEALVHALTEGLESIDPAAALAALYAPMDFYRMDQIQSIIDRLHKQYYEPVSLMYQHQTITFASEMRESYLQLYRLILKVFNSQQTRYKQSTNSLIVYQLSSWLTLKSRLELLELVLFHFALIPLHLQMESEIQKQSPTEKVNFGRSGSVMTVNPATARRLIEQMIASCRTLYQVRCEQSRIIYLEQRFMKLFSEMSFRLERLHARRSISTGEVLIRPCKGMQDSRYDSPMIRRWATNYRLQDLHTLCYEVLHIKHDIDSYDLPKASYFQRILEVSANKDLNELSNIWKTCLYQGFLMDVHFLCDRMTDMKYSPIVTTLKALNTLWIKFVERETQQTQESITPLSLLGEDKPIPDLITDVMPLALESLALHKQLHQRGCQPFDMLWSLNNEFTELVKGATWFASSCHDDIHSPNDEDETDEQHLHRFTFSHKCYELTRDLCQWKRQLLTNANQSWQKLGYEINLSLIAFKPALHFCNSHIPQSKDQLFDYFFFSMESTVTDLVAHAETSLGISLEITIVDAIYSVVKNVLTISGGSNPHIFDANFVEMSLLMLSFCNDCLRQLGEEDEDSENGDPSEEVLQQIEDKLKKIAATFQKWYLLHEQEKTKLAENVNTDSSTGTADLRELQTIKKLLQYELCTQTLSSAIAKEDTLNQTVIEARSFIDEILKAAEGLHLSDVLNQVEQFRTNKTNSSTVNFDLLEHAMFWIEISLQACRIVAEISEYGFSARRVDRVYCMTKYRKMSKKMKVQLLQDVRVMCLSQLQHLVEYTSKDDDNTLWLFNAQNVELILSQLQEHQINVVSSIQEFGEQWKELCDDFVGEYVALQQKNNENKTIDKSLFDLLSISP